MIKDQIFEEYFKNQYSSHTDIHKYYSDYYAYTSKSIWIIFENYIERRKDVRILDLWCGFWGFANFCNVMWFENYVGIDLSSDELEIARANFPKYQFIQENIFEFLEKSKDTFDSYNQFQSAITKKKR